MSLRTAPPLFRNPGQSGGAGDPSPWPAVLRGGLHIIALWACGAVLSGCSAGLVGLIVGGLVLAERGPPVGDADVPPVLTSFTLAPVESPDRILISFAYRNEDPGKLGVTVEFARLDGPDGSGQRRGARRPATRIAESAPVDLSDIPNGGTVHFYWDAKRDLDGNSAQVEITLTPFEDGEPGTPFSSQPFIAGNTPVEIRNLILSSVNELVVASFDLVDAESNTATLLPSGCHLAGVMIDVGEGFTSLPRAVLDKVRKGFPSAPGPEGAPANLSFLITDLKLREAQPGDACPGQEALGQLGAPGFVGPVKIQIALRDFPTEGPTVLVSEAITVDNNNPPLVETLSIDPGDLDSGVVPIRYRLYDKGSERNSADIRVEFKVEREDEFRPANEYPTPPSEGRTGLATADLATFGAEGLPFHTFLWDAGSQVGAPEKVIVKITASDREEGPESLPQTITGLSLVPFKRAAIAMPVGDGPSGMTAADFDQDGVFDLAVARRNAGTITVLHGGSGSLESRPPLEVGPRPSALLSGDFDSDGFPDLVVASEGSEQTSSRLSFFGGSIDGLSNERVAISDLGTQAIPTALVQGDLDQDGFPDVVVAKSGPGRLAYLRGGMQGFIPATEIPSGNEPGPLAIDDFDGDGHLDLVVSNKGFPFRLTYFWGEGKGLSEAGGRTEIEVQQAPAMLTTGDLNGDRRPDVVVASTASSEVTYLESGPRGAGESGVRRKVTREAGGESLRAIASGDFDGDGLIVTVHRQKRQTVEGWN